MDFTASTIEGLVKLFQQPEPDVLQGEDLQSTPIEMTSTRNQDPCSQETAHKVPTTIEEFEEQEAKESECLASIGSGMGQRKQPTYHMKYQQTVSPEEVFLQMTGKTPATSSCENLILTVMMPGDKKENIEVGVDAKGVVIGSSRHYLDLPLAHPVNPDKSDVKWNSETESLILTLCLDRELDFINF